MKQTLDKKNQPADFTPKEFFGGILRHWLLIIVLIALALGATVLYYMSYVPKYTSTARILLENQNSQLTKLSAVNTGGTPATTIDAIRVVSNEVQFLKSLKLAKGVDKIIGFAKIPEFKTATNGKKLDVYDHFAKNLKIGKLPDSNVIEISYTAEQPRLAVQMVTVITDVYKAQKSNQGVTANKDASTWLSVKVRELQEKQRAADARIVDYRIQHGIFDGQNNQKLLSQQLTALNGSIVTVSSQRAEIVARADLINRLLDRNGNLDSARDVLSSTVIQQYRTQVLTLQRSIAEQSEALLPTHPKMLSLNAELRNVNDQIRAEARNIMLSLRNEVEISRQRESSLKSELNGLKNAEAGSLVQSVELNALKSEASSNRTLLGSYLAKYREADVRNKSDLDNSEVHVISAAVLPLKPSGIARNSVFAVMGVVGLLIGLVIATVRTLNRYSRVQPINGKNSQKRSMRNAKQVNAKHGFLKKPARKAKNANITRRFAEGKIAFQDLSFMAAIPLTTSSNRQNNILKNDILANLDSEYANSFIDLVDNLMVQSDNGFQKHFMISGVEDDNESYEALLNLGRILDLKGAKVLILDLDIDSHIFSPTVIESTNFGFSDVIGEQCYFEDCIIKDNKSGAEILLAGNNIGLIDEIITSTEMEEFLDDLDQIYDVILIHSSDVNQQHITSFIDGQVDLTLLVADWEDRATERLETALLTLKDFQSSEFGLLLMSADMNEFNSEVG